MTAKVDFKKLTLRDALDLAVLVEQEAKDRYEELASQMQLHHNPEAAAFFLRMKQIETIHETELARSRKEQFGDAPVTVTREMLFDVEAPAYDDARATMTVRQALDMALTAETKAFRFFDSAIGEVQDKKVAGFFAQLRDEEHEHQNLVRAQIAKLPPDTAMLTADDVSDPPQAL